MAFHGSKALMVQRSAAKRQRIVPKSKYLNQTTVVFEDFNDDSGSLVGETANMGQVWLTGGLSGGLVTGTQYGQPPGGRPSAPA